MVSTRKEDELAGLKFLLVKACDADGKPTGGDGRRRRRRRRRRGRGRALRLGLVGAADQGDQGPPGRRHHHGDRRSGRDRRRRALPEGRQLIDAMQLDEKRIQEIVEKVMARLGSADLPSSPLEAIERAVGQDGAAAEGAGVRAAAARRDQAREHPRAAGAARHLPRRRLGGEGGAQGVRAVRPRADRDARQDDRGDARDHARRTCASWPSTPSPRPASAASRTRSRRTRSSPTKTPGTEILRPITYSGDHGLMITERAPFGVFGAITPTTNPTETISTTASACSPAATRWCSTCTRRRGGSARWLVHLLNEAIVGGGRAART